MTWTSSEVLGNLFTTGAALTTMYFMMKHTKPRKGASEALAFTTETWTGSDGDSQHISSCSESSGEDQVSSRRREKTRGRDLGKEGRREKSECASAASGPAEAAPRATTGREQKILEVFSSISLRTLKRSKGAGGNDYFAKGVESPASSQKATRRGSPCPTCEESLRNADDYVFQDERLVKIQSPLRTEEEDEGGGGSSGATHAGRRSGAPVSPQQQEAAGGTGSTRSGSTDLPWWLEERPDLEKGDSPAAARRSSCQSERAARATRGPPRCCYRQGEHDASDVTVVSAEQRDGIECEDKEEGEEEEECQDKGMMMELSSYEQACVEMYRLAAPPGSCSSTVTVKGDYEPEGSLTSPDARLQVAECRRGRGRGRGRRRGSAADPTCLRCSCARARKIKSLGLSTPAVCFYCHRFLSEQRTTRAFRSKINSQSVSSCPSEKVRPMWKYCYKC